MAGRPKKYGSDEERRAADAERKRRAREQDVDPELPARDINEEPLQAHPSIEKVIAQAIPGSLSPEDEQKLRDHFGYAKSETRTKAERDATAARILGRPSAGMISLEEYVRRTVSEALAYSKAINETDAPWPIPGTDRTMENRRTDRLARAEHYARWRYAGFLSGEVASL